MPAAAPADVVIRHARVYTVDEAKQICQDSHTRELRRAAWMAYMESHDPPEE